MHDHVPTADRLARALRERFGFDALRPGQAEALQAVLAGRDVLVVMPTGAGKSLVYQLAAVLTPGTTVVISPLVALMKDQVDGLRRRGVAAAALHAAQPEAERRAALAALRAGRLELVYVAPERLRNRAFLDALAAARVGLLAVDEAHCVSQWGHDFRPDYLQIAAARRRMGRPPCVALTATATPRVQDDVAALLELHDPVRVVTGFNRPNLCFEVVSTPTAREKRRVLARLVASTDGAALVYVPTRRQAETVARALAQDTGRAAHVYHAGLADRARAKVQDAFVGGHVDLVVATNAFGMGVDRPDVRLVAHAALPADLEAYYQEAGRAGRDGLPARAVLLYAPHDAALRAWFVEQAAPEKAVLRRTFGALERVAEDGTAAFVPDDLAQRLDLHPVRLRVALALLRRAGALERLDDLAGRYRVALRRWDGARVEAALEAARGRQRRKTEALRRMVHYAEADTCRRALLLAHFGDRAPPEAARCCDVCFEATEAPPPASLPPFEALPMPSRVALGLLDAVRRLPFPVGRRTLARLLAGSRAQGMDRRAYTSSPYFGRLAFLAQDAIDDLYRQLLVAGYLKVTGTERPVVQLTPRGRRALAHREAVPLALPPAPEFGTAVPPAERGGGGRAAEPVLRFEALRRWRAAVARREGVPPFLVFPDRTLQAVAAANPATEEALRAVPGVGPAKLARYGAAVLAVLRGEMGAEGPAASSSGGCATP